MRDAARRQGVSSTCPGAERVPILHLLNMMALAEQMGLPYDLVPLPRPGANTAPWGAP
jgi:hypothetical protein